MILRIIAVGALLACPVTGSCGANFEIADQSNIVVTNPGGGSSGYVINFERSAAQVVTAGVSGQLSRIEVRVGEAGEFGVPLNVDIAKAVGQAADFSASGRLASRSIASTSISDASDFSLNLDFTADNLRFAAGESFAIVMRSTRPLIGYYWSVNDPSANTYPGGSASSLQIATGIVTNTDNDTQFRTFMLVPEPSALALAASSLLGLLAIGRRCAG